jgi:hypothetical protein
MGGASGEIDCSAEAAAGRPNTQQWRNIGGLGWRRSPTLAWAYSCFNGLGGVHVGRGRRGPRRGIERVRGWPIAARELGRDGGSSGIHRQRAAVQEGGLVPRRRQGKRSGMGRTGSPATRWRSVREVKDNCVDRICSRTGREGIGTAGGGHARGSRRREAYRLPPAGKKAGGIWDTHGREEGGQDLETFHPTSRLYISFLIYNRF